MASQLVAGNSAVIVGAMYAGCDCFFGYPITPGERDTARGLQVLPEVGRKFVQAESEEAAINMVYGAAAAGHRVLTASSGPGISLKQEGISYLAGAELPCVIVDIMRAGPGLGNIGPEQSDYNQACQGRRPRQLPQHRAGAKQRAGDVRLHHAGLRPGLQVPQSGSGPGRRRAGADGRAAQVPGEGSAAEIDTTWAVAGNAATRGKPDHLHLPGLRRAGDAQPQAAGEVRRG